MGWGLNQYELVKIPVKKVCKIYYLRWYYNGWHYWAFLPGRVLMITEGEEYRTIGTKKISMGSGQITRGQCAAIRTIMNTREIALLTIAGWMNIRIEPGTVNIYDNQLAGNEIEFVAVVGSKDVSYSDGYSPVGYVPEVPAETTYCEIIIGDQIWMCYNYASAYPGSKVYNNDEANRSLFGGLYTYNQIMNPGFCPVGWHVPTLAEWQTLINFVGGDAVAGGVLKSIGFVYWFAPNTGAINAYGFGARGGGYNSSGIFADLFISGYYWTASEITDYSASHLYFRYNMASLTSAGFAALKTMFASVRLIKNIPYIPHDDWFLPSRDELMAMCVELHNHGIGGFFNGVYLSSSEFNATFFYTVDFVSTTAPTHLKFFTSTVRACRSFVSILPYALRDIGPSGGWIFYKNGNNYLEAASLDQSPNYIWSNIINILIGTTGMAIGAGQGNTNDIIGQPGHIDSAAKLCKDLIL